VENAKHKHLLKYSAKFSISSIKHFASSGAKDFSDFPNVERECGWSEEEKAKRVASTVHENVHMCARTENQKVKVVEISLAKLTLPRSGERERKHSLPACLC
jgi:hypothetical protein